MLQTDYEIEGTLTMWQSGQKHDVAGALFFLHVALR